MRRLQSLQCDYWILICFFLLISISHTFPLLPTISLRHVPNKVQYPVRYHRTETRRKRILPCIYTTTATTTTLQSTLGLIDYAVVRASLQATAKLLTSIGVGGWAAKKNIASETDGVDAKVFVLDGPALQSLSKLAYWIFQPAYLLSSVAQTIYEATKKSVTASSICMPGNLLLLMLLSASCHLAIGGLVGFIFTKILQPEMDETEQRDVRMSTTFANAGPLPLIFNDALFPTSPEIQKCVAACISFYLLVWVPMFWTVGRIILGTYDTSSNNADKENTIIKIFNNLKKILSPPIIGSIIGIVIGSIPQLGAQCFVKGAMLTPIMSAMNTLGSAYLPVATLILAGSLFGNDGVVSTNKKKSTTTDDDDEVCIVDDYDVVCTSYTAPTIKTISSILIARYFVAPITSLGLFISFKKLGWLGASTAPGALSIFAFVLFMEGCMPPNQQSVILLQLDKQPQRAAVMAKLLTTVYVISIIPVTFLLSLCLSRSRILSFIT